MLSLVTPSLKSSRHRKRTAQEKLYSYNPLRSPRHIRLLKLLPGEGGTWLRCSLVEVHLETNLPYQAISYAWGDANDQRSVLCKGKFINITRNLLDALTVFRHPEAARYLWADAICINQRNEEERSAQVQLMGQIYSKASQVLFWVGME
ncbi:HET-domain-containing protein, partial [Plenodomus tracheiphilus IPT5]